MRLECLTFSWRLTNYVRRYIFPFLCAFHKPVSELVLYSDLLWLGRIAQVAYFICPYSLSIPVMKDIIFSTPLTWPTLFRFFKNFFDFPFNILHISFVRPSLSLSRHFDIFSKNPLHCETWWLLSLKPLSLQDCGKARIMILYRYILSLEVILKQSKMGLVSKPLSSELLDLLFL